MQTDKHYSTGRPCKRGHLAPRFRSTGNCTECNRERGRVVNMTPLQVQEQRDRAKADYYKDPERTRLFKSIDWANWYARNPKRALAMTREQQAKRLKRVPPWSETEAIKAFYEACPEGYEVDHIIPLQGLFVSGLHVLGNLQYLPTLENRRKGRSF